jgi:hypothetical protein
VLATTIYAGKALFAYAIPGEGLTAELRAIRRSHRSTRKAGRIGTRTGGSSQPFKLSRNVASGTLLKNVVYPLLATALEAALAVSPLVGREAITLSAVPAGFFGILFGLRYGVMSQDAGSTLIASTDEGRRTT